MLNLRATIGSLIFSSNQTFTLKFRHMIETKSYVINKHNLDMLKNTLMVQFS